MKFHVIKENGEREEVRPLEYLKAPMCRRAAFMDYLKELRAEREARRCIKLHEELEHVAEAGLRLVKE